MFDERGHEAENAARAKRYALFQASERAEAAFFAAALAVRAAIIAQGSALDRWKAALEAWEDAVAGVK